jgi:hypothetical protein
LKEVQKGNADKLPSNSNGSHLRQEITHSDASSSSSEVVKDSPAEDMSLISFIRERVDVFGKVRLMEPAEEIPSLQLKPSEIGIIKEAPIRRWLDGQAKWDKLYKHSAERAISKRKKFTEHAEAMLRSARERGLTLVNENADEDETPTSERREFRRRASIASIRSNAAIQPDRRWGPLDLEGERVPPSAICNRRDTQEALALLKKSIYYTAPRTHHTIPTFKPGQLVKAAMNPQDRIMHPPKQSASEEQQRNQTVHGLRMWTGLVSMFMERSSMEKLEKGRKKAKGKVVDGTRHMNNTVRPSGMLRHESHRSP